ncbi:hypothetical protein A4G19_09395 [Pasteurellaceae bacterium Macca]|nr:hypothetical protein [Pasteurellaceae bacterium Macca]
MENKKMDYSFLNSTEIQAISINWQNSQNGTNLPIYPYFADTFDLFGELIEFAPVESKSGLKSLHNELSVIVKHLIELFPKPWHWIPKKRLTQSQVKQFQTKYLNRVW